MATKASDRQARFDNAHCKRYSVKLHNVIDSDIIARLSEEHNIQGFIKKAIRFYMEHEPVAESEPDEKELKQIEKEEADTMYTWQDFDNLPFDIREGVLNYWESGYDYSDDSDLWESCGEPVTPEFKKACQMYDYLQSTDPECENR